jgi:large repetitive protein
MDQELAQPFDPSGLQGTITVTGINLTPGSASDTVGGTHTVTTTITDQLGNPQPNIHVTFAVTAGPNVGVVGVTSPLNGNTNPSGQVTFTYTSNGVAGTDTIIAQFTNAANQVITSQPVTETWTQSATVATTTNLTSDVNPSPFGQLVTFSATVTPNGGGTPTTGSIEFLDGSTSLGVVNLSGGPVSVSTNSLTVGTHTITAKYSGGTGFDPSKATLAQVVNQASTTTALASSQNPSTVGQPVTLTASVSSAGGTPTGSVEFFDGSTSLGVVNLSGGTAALPTSTLTAGSHGITAVYSGDPNFLTSQGTLTQTVTYATTLLGDYSKPKESGSTLPVKLEVTDYNGVNLSSPDLAVKAVGIAPAGSSVPTMPAQDAGKSNPGGPFRNVSDGYIFNLKLVDAMGNGLAAGDYTLFYTIGDDPTLHTFSFSVKKK